MTQTIGSRLDSQRGLAEGFDFLRLALALGVVAWHCAPVVSGQNFDDSKFVWIFGYSILCAFFALSGFLIAGSALRLSLSNFLVNRALRIVPALAVEIVLSALILGPLLTTLSLSSYFRNTGTWQYFTNIFGLINFTLPGVFKDHPSNIVNNSLWTVPHEIGCYIVMSGLMVTGFLKKPLIHPILAGLIIGLGMSLPLLGINSQSTGISKVFYALLIGKASRLYVFFLIGIFFYLRRNVIPYSWFFFYACVAITLFVGTFPHDHRIDIPWVSLVLAIPLSYIVVFIGVTNVWLPKICRKGDYSYGIYLYGWPLQQLLVSLFPNGTSTIIQFIIVIPLITIFAAFSWHFIERPVLQLRKKFSFIARVRLAENEQTKLKV